MCPRGAVLLRSPATASLLLVSTCNSLRINSSESVSKQMVLTTLESTPTQKPGWGPSFMSYFFTCSLRSDSYSLQGALKFGARVHGLAMRHDYVLERQLQQFAQRGQDAFLVPWRGPDA